MLDAGTQPLPACAATRFERGQHYLDRTVPWRMQYRLFTGVGSACKKCSDVSSREIRCTSGRRPVRVRFLKEHQAFVWRAVQDPFRPRHSEPRA